MKSPDTDNNEDESRFDRNVVTGIIEKERKGVEGGGQERPKSPLAGWFKGLLLRVEGVGFTV